MRARSNDRFDKLCNAAFNGDLETVKQLAKLVDLSGFSKDGFTPLHLAVLGGHRAIVDYLCVCGADVCAVDQRGFGVLQTAVKASGIKPPDRMRLVSDLLEKGADARYASDPKYEIVNLATYFRRSKKLIELLKQAIAD